MPGSGIKNIEYFAEKRTLRIHQEFHYTTLEPVPIDDVISSLQGLKVLLKASPRIIQGFIPDIDIQGVDIYVEEIKDGSLLDLLKIDIVFGGEDHYQKFREMVQKWSAKKYNADPNDPDQVEQYEKEIMKRFLYFVGAVTISSGITYAIATSGSDQASQTTVNVHDNTIINFGAGEFDMTGDQIKAIVKSATQDKQKEIAKAAIKAIKPAKQDDQATLDIGGITEVSFSQEVVKAVPAKYTPPMPTEQTADYQNADVVIYASDIGQRRKVWAGIVPGIIDDRVKFLLSDDLDPSKIHGNLRFKADISVIKKFSKAENKYIIDSVLIKSTNL
ncbi:hypothetical protein [Thiomicrorhabdus sp. Kp2]|uniref:hypothetical protein n=1 Tax=Thiomicrorhabdus sp. Kp2 TaxID=1123518 RepID=UPI0003FFDB24|nr:hypothetical protein [Thiomicrorhabdus sp. Kp2]